MIDEGIYIYQVACLYAISRNEIYTILDETCPNSAKRIMIFGLGMVIRLPIC